MGLGVISDNSQNSISDEELLKSRELLEDVGVRTINEYGTTLASLSDDEFLKVTLNWRGRNDVLPQSTHFFIGKATVHKAGRYKSSPPGELFV